MKQLLPLILVCCLVGCSPAQETELNKAYSSVCVLNCTYIGDDKEIHFGRYSGMVFKKTNNNYYILTCGHGPKHSGVGGKVDCYFYRGSKISKAIEGTVVWWKYTVNADDIGFIRITKKAFVDAEYPEPRVAELASKNYDVDTDAFAITIGRPKAEYLWPTAFVAKITKTHDDIGCMKFIPCPQQGRSGSAILIRNKIVGVVVAQSKKGGYGKAVKLPIIRRSWRAYIDSTDKD